MTTTMPKRVGCSSVAAALTVPAYGHALQEKEGED
jgi:hypothetical protein